MDCCEFREKYSDFADGLLADTDEHRFRLHLTACAACRRFDTAFRSGINALRGLPSVRVSRSFGERLRSRLRHELAVRALAMNPWSGAVGALLVLATVGVIAWDLTEMRAVRQPLPVVAASLPPAALRVPPVTIPLDTAEIFRTGFHPFDPTLLVADTGRALDANQPRFDIPAVWGGR